VSRLKDEKADVAGEKKKGESASGGRGNVLDSLRRRVALPGRRN